MFEENFGGFPDPALVQLASGHVLEQSDVFNHSLGVFELAGNGHRGPPLLNKMMPDLFSVSQWAFRSSSAHRSPLRSSQAMPTGVTRSAGTAARAPARPSRLGSSPSPSSARSATSGSSTRPSTRSPVALPPGRPRRHRR